MKLATVAAVVTATLAAALLVQATATPAAQDKPAAGSRTGVLNLRDCLDWTRNSWIADIDLEVQKQKESESGRASDLNPRERARIRAKIEDLSNRRRLEVYNEIVRLSGVIAKERGFDLIQRVDRMPLLEGGEGDLGAQIDRRAIVHHDSSIDITAEVIDRINKEHAARKK